ncbi:MAG: hypothetical protein IJS59_07815 [Bacteroidaceae bacterium]|nr:hypothetical protein [Bacteroidaceae bacterium]
MQHTLRIAFVLLVAVLAACTNKSANDKAGDTTPHGTQATDAAVTAAATDTLVGYVGDATSMHNLEFLTLGGDTMEFELSDDVDRRADLMVGNAVAVVVSHDADGEDRVVATLDPREVGFDVEGSY